jgi:uncharacterized protein
MRKLYIAAVLLLVVTSAIWGWLSYLPHRASVPRPSTAVDRAEPALPELTAPVNDFAGLIDHDSILALDATISSLERQTGDVIVVATLAHCGSAEAIKACSMRLFENHGKGIGQRGKDNGVLVLVVADMRQVRITLGYGIEPIISDRDATAITETMTSSFRTGRYGEGFRAGVQSIVAQIKAARGVR